MLIEETVNTILGKVGSNSGGCISFQIKSQAGTLAILNLPFGKNISDVGFVVVPIGTQIPNSRYKLQQYIPAELERTTDGFIIRCHSIDEEAYGDTYGAAYSDFLTSIRDHYESLVKREKRLSSCDKAVLEKLRSLLQSN